MAKLNSTRVYGTIITDGTASVNKLIIRDMGSVFTGVGVLFQRGSAQFQAHMSTSKFFLEQTSGGQGSGIVINASNNIGIGNENPGYKLDINTSTNYNHLRVGGSGAPLIKFAQSSYNSGNGAELWQQDGKFHINVNSSLLGMVVDTSANVGIGLASPGAKLDVNGNALIRGPLQIAAGDTNGNFNEGIRLAPANNGWTGIAFNGTGFSGTPSWFLARNPDNVFIIAANDSSTTSGLALNSGGNLNWRNNRVWHQGNLTINTSGTTLIINVS